MYFQYGQEETEYLSGKDEKLGAVIAQVGRVNREVDTDLFSAVVHHIVGQQISTKAQATIWQRMRGALGTVDAEHILEAGNEQLQLLGISCRKAEYITDFARKIQNGEFDLEGIWQKPDEEVIRELSALKGIGVWTAEMILLFCMQRPDVFSYDDLAIQRGLRMVYFGSSLPAPLLFAAMVIGSVLAGAIWAFVPAWFKSRWNTNETLFTLMMNYVATSIVACMTNIMRGQASSLGTLNKATKAGWLPVINGQRYTINIIVVLVLTFAMYAYLKYSKQGYEISVVGESENTARYAGINVSRVMIRTMLLSGAICGLCGFLVVAGKDQTISTTSAGGNGFTAIIVAWLAKFNTFYMMLISFLLIFLDRGASEIASAYSLNEYAADIITGIILFFILGSEFFINYRLVWRGHHDGKEGK